MPVLYRGRVEEVAVTDLMVPVEQYAYALV
jgi:hypothetical protein